jgi:hypothetical protein
MKEVAVMAADTRAALSARAGRRPRCARRPLLRRASRHEGGGRARAALGARPARARASTEEAAGARVALGARPARARAGTEEAAGTLAAAVSPSPTPTVVRGPR